MELAILENTNQQNSNGLHHFGIQTDDFDGEIRSASKRLQSGRRLCGTNPAPPRETWLSDPSGNHIYLSVEGTLEYQPVEKYAYRKKK